MSTTGWVLGIGALGAAAFVGYMVLAPREPAAFGSSAPQTQSQTPPQDNTQAIFGAITAGITAASNITTAALANSRPPASGATVQNQTTASK